MDALNETEFDENSFEVRNAKMVIARFGDDIPKISPPPDTLEVNVKNVTITGGGNILLHSPQENFSSIG